MIVSTTVDLSKPPEWTPPIFGWHYPIRVLGADAGYQFASSVLPQGYVIRFKNRVWVVYNRTGRKEASGSLQWCARHVELLAQKLPKKANPDGDDVLQQLRLLAQRHGWRLSRWSLDRVVLP